LLLSTEGYFADVFLYFSIVKRRTYIPLYSKFYSDLTTDISAKTPGYELDGKEWFQIDSP
jgi:hypothetical protein